MHDASSKPVTEETIEPVAGQVAGSSDEPPIAASAGQAPGDHSIALPGGGFRLWRWAVLRGAGFPVAELERLAAPQTTALVAGGGSDEELASVYAGEREAISAALCDIARSSRFREALCWQNRTALESSISSLLAGRRVGKRKRYTERIVASYVQRYCTKNDTIGSFGPSAWVQLRPRGAALDLEVGAGMVDHVWVSLEHWAVVAVAEAIAQDDALRPWLRPRLLPWVRLDRTTLHVATVGAMPLDAHQARILSACDGTRAAGDLAASIEQRSNGEVSVQRVYDMLDRAGQMGVLTWTLEVPLEPNPEEALRARLEEMAREARMTGTDAGQAREAVKAGLATLARLEQARDEVIAAGSDPDRLQGALAGFDEVFEQVAERSSRRNPGRTYGARTPIVQDCHRDVTMSLGPGFLERLGPPLSLLLRGARWLTGQVGERYRARLGKLYRQCVERTGEPVVELAALQGPLMAEEPEKRTDPPTPAVRESMAEMQRRWAEILRPDPGVREISRRVEDVADAVAELFPGEGPGSRPGWPQARFICPDVMIDASGPDAVISGRYRLVLNEIHVTNSVALHAFGVHHPDLAALRQAVRRDYGRPRLSLAVDGASVRFCDPLLLPDDHRLAYDERPSPGKPPARSLPIAELVVEERDGRLVVRTRDGGREWDPLEVIGDLLSDVCSREFRLLPSATHVPRMSIGDLVVWRESWRLRPAELPWIKVSSPAKRFAASQRWAAGLGLPRMIFAKVTSELKPRCVDLHSPVLVDGFATMIKGEASRGRDGGVISLTEMLPDIGHAWLPDAAGNRYTSELRLVAVG